MRVGNETAFVHVPGQDPVQDRGAGQGGPPVHIRVSRVEGVQPEAQRLDVTDYLLDVVRHEGQRPQAAGPDPLPPDRGRARRQAEGSFHARHVPLTNLLVMR